MHSVSVRVSFFFSIIVLSCRRNKCLQLQPVEHCLLLFPVKLDDSYIFFNWGYFYLFKLLVTVMPQALIFFFRLG